MDPVLRVTQKFVQQLEERAKDKLTPDLRLWISTHLPKIINEEIPPHGQAC
jgi:hypothetical protein